MLENKTFNSVTINIFTDIKVNLPYQNTGFKKMLILNKKCQKAFLPFSQSPQIPEPTAI